MYQYLINTYQIFTRQQMNKARMVQALEDKVQEEGFPSGKKFIYDAVRELLNKFPNDTWPASNHTVMADVQGLSIQISCHRIYPLD